VIIDAHVHLQGSVYLGDERAGVDDLLRAMDEAGVSRAIVVGLEPEDSESIIEIATSYSSRLTSFIVVDPEDRTSFVIERAVVEGRIGGLGEIYLKCGPSQLPEAYLRPVLKAARTHALPVMIHTGDFSYTAPLLVTDMARRFPDVIFILAHMGSITFVLDAIEIAKMFPNVYLETSGMTSPSMLRRAVAECGPERILFGSDYPFWHPLVELERIKATDLGMTTTRMILGENIAHLLGP
jgi:predicted TIM-barrel fold metal-dependent hydrolase